MPLLTTIPAISPGVSELCVTISTDKSEDHCMNHKNIVDTSSITVVFAKLTWTLMRLTSICYGVKSLTQSITIFIT